ncbi:hypothetical protein NVP1081O_044 [Vibrio phage 1.081.O._10N.286.52.C2]|nr:hypothetical protein NVP1081O_044 [Vibrio phage 1.081.O._10N.286.52.C2]
MYIKTISKKQVAKPVELKSGSLVRVYVRGQQYLAGLFVWNGASNSSVIYDIVNDTAWVIDTATCRLMSHDVEIPYTRFEEQLTCSELYTDEKTNNLMYNSDEVEEVVVYEPLKRGDVIPVELNFNPVNAIVLHASKQHLAIVADGTPFVFNVIDVRCGRFCNVDDRPLGGILKQCSLPANIVVNKENQSTSELQDN